MVTKIIALLLLAVPCFGQIAFTYTDQPFLQTPTGSSAAACQCPTLPTLPYTNNIKLWLNADCAVTNSSDACATTSDFVKGWGDLSGNGSHVVQLGNDAIRPRYTLNAVNGHAAISWTNCTTGTVLTNKPISIASPFTAFIVFKYVTGRTPDFAPFPWSGETGANKPRSFIQDGGVSGSLSLFDSSGISTSSTIARTTWGAGIYVYNGASSTVKLAAASGIGSGNPGSDALAGLLIGNHFSVTGGFQYCGEIAEFIMYGEAMSLANRKLVQCYITTKYGTTDDQVPCTP